MGIVRQFLVLFVGCVSLAGYNYYRSLTVPLPIPEFTVDQYWGPGDGSKYREDTTIRSFTILYNSTVIDKLHKKLTDLPHITAPLEGAGAFEYGFNGHRLREVLHYWRTVYLPKWTTEREPYLNQFPQFITQIQGLDIHYIHVRPDFGASGGLKKTVVPLLLLHGWPGSVREFYDIIPRLIAPSQDRDFVFEVIVPSLPGFGWSQGSAKVGLGPRKMAIIMRNLMARIGHERYYVHGGDWGTLIGDLMGTFFPESVIGVHLSGCGVAGTLATWKTLIASLAPSFFVAEPRHIPYYFPLTAYFKDAILEGGYAHLQATKPDTIGAALVGAPVGLAAYILEKFSTQTNRAFRSLPDGGLERAFTMDALLDNVMVYYLTDSIATSQRLYAEAFSVREMFSGELGKIPNRVPAACAKFRHDVLHTIDWALKDHFVNLVQSNHFDEGGHFSVMELPEVVYGDLVTFATKVSSISREG
ncbi:juvenile hormone epoxide hydrolase 1-like [Anopheles ziemanni]|uniref:juvenile hormone epoxide hydrolase 1-like n=1 Tax=Anopheles coustani TaxID=139045 RepID=UPI00265A593E|nr:juvenile hormone epoxide hydrolase 1-like [Anopheles coustani]XP_058168326.1 juvenile hormone epoxide hydrolase 1-like [Anopheles ziemanni]